MGRNKTLYKHMNDVLYSKYKAAQDMDGGRHAYKLQTGKHTHDEFIWSSGSYKAHRGRIKQFWAFVREKYPEHKKTSLEDLDRSVAVAFLNFQHESGKSASTLSSDMAAINKTFEFSLTKSDDDLRLPARNMDNFSNNRSGKPYEELMPRQREVVDISRAFGLRRAEIEALTDKSIIEGRDGKLYAYVCGKGGRVRVAECLADKEQDMRERFGQYIKIVAIDSISADRNEFKAYMEGSKRIEKSFGHDTPVHRLGRQYYAQTLLKQVESEGREVPLLRQNETKSGMETYTTNGVKMRRDHAQIVSQNLGHNRIDVLKNYIFQGEG